MTKTKYNTRKATHNKSNLPTKKTKHNMAESNNDVINIYDTNVNEKINAENNMFKNNHKVQENTNIVANVTPNTQKTNSNNNNNLTANNSLAENNNNIVEHLFIEKNNFESSFGKFNIIYF